MKEENIIQGDEAELIIFTSKELLDHLITKVIPLAKKLKVPPEAQTTTPKLPEMQAVGTVSVLVMELEKHSELAEDKYNRVKVHCTLMNSTFIQDGEQETANSRSRKPDRTKYSFDASEFLKKYEKYKFGQVCIDKLYFNERFQASDDDYYKTISTVQF